MAILGGALILFGVTLLVLVDAPRRALMRLTALGTGIRSRGGASPVGRWAKGPRTAAPSPPQSPDAPDDFLGLAPGWYRDPSNPAQARYWNGSTLGEERRPVTTPPAPEVAPLLATYKGLAPGWYRDHSKPDMARYWNGTTLSEERRLVSR